MTYEIKLKQQREVFESIEKQLKQIDENTKHDENEMLENNQRYNEIINYNNEKYYAKNKFLIQFIVAYGLLIIFIGLIYGKLIPTFIGYPIGILYGTLVSLYLFSFYTDIDIRSKRYFEKYIFTKHNPKKNTNTTNEENLNNQCIGEECCPSGTIFNSDLNMCQVEEQI